MERQLSGPIRKLIYGLIPGEPQMIIMVGGNVNAKIKGISRPFKICEIIEDTSTFEKYGRFEYLIYVKEEGVRDAQIIFFDRIYKAPDRIQYFLPDEIEEILI